MIDLSQLKLALFDLDVTIRTNRGFPNEILKAFGNLKLNSIQTSVVTGTGYIRLKQIFGSKFSDICTLNTPIAVENGGRITDHYGTNLKYYSLSKKEICRLIKLWLNQNNDSFLYFFPKVSTEKAVIVPLNISLHEKLINKYGSFTKVLKNSNSIELLTNYIYELKPCMVSHHFYKKTFIQDQLKGFNVVQNEGDIHINKKGIDKRQALIDVMSLTKVSPDKILIVGNGLNDLPMLTYPYGKKIVVGNLIKKKLFKNNVDFVKNPKHLGQFLLNSI